MPPAVPVLTFSSRHSSCCSTVQTTRLWSPDGCQSQTLVLLQRDGLNPHNNPFISEAVTRPLYIPECACGCRTSRLIILGWALNCEALVRFAFKSSPRAAPGVRCLNGAITTASPSHVPLWEAWVELSPAGLVSDDTISHHPGHIERFNRDRNRQNGTDVWSQVCGSRFSHVKRKI